MAERAWPRTNGITALHSQWRASRHPLLHSCRICPPGSVSSRAGALRVPQFSEIRTCAAGPARSTFDSILASRAQRILDLDLAARLLLAVVSFPGKSAL